MSSIRRQHNDAMLRAMDLDQLQAVWSEVDHFARHTAMRKPQRQAELAAKYLGWLIDQRLALDGIDPERPFSWNDDPEAAP